MSELQISVSEEAEPDLDVIMAAEELTLLDNPLEKFALLEKSVKLEEAPVTDKGDEELRYAEAYVVAGNLEAADSPELSRTLFFGALTEKLKQYATRKADAKRIGQPLEALTLFDSGEDNSHLYTIIENHEIPESAVDALIAIAQDTSRNVKIEEFDDLKSLSSFDPNHIEVISVLNSIKQSGDFDKHKANLYNASEILAFDLKNRLSSTPGYQHNQSKTLTDLCEFISLGDIRLSGTSVELCITRCYLSPERNKEGQLRPSNLSRFIFTVN